MMVMGVVRVGVYVGGRMYDHAVQCTTTYHRLDEVDSPPGPAAVLLHGPLVVVDVAPVEVHLVCVCVSGPRRQATADQ